MTTSYCVLSNATRERVDGALPSPRRVDEAPEFRELEYLGGPDDPMTAPVSQPQTASADTKQWRVLGARKSHEERETCDSIGPLKL
jgi:hypothetical protein